MKWNKIIGYDKNKDYHCQPNEVILPKPEKRVLFFYHNNDKDNLMGDSFLGYVKIDTYGIPRIYESAIGGIMYNYIPNGMQWSDDFTLPEREL